MPIPNMVPTMTTVTKIVVRTVLGAKLLLALLLGAKPVLAGAISRSFIDDTKGRNQVKVNLDIIIISLRPTRVGIRYAVGENVLCCDVCKLGVCLVRCPRR